MNDYPYQFTAKVGIFDFGRMKYAVVYVPKKILTALPKQKTARYRCVGEIAGQPWNGAIQPAGKGKFYIMLSKRMLKECQLAVGDVVEVFFQLDDPNAVEVPAELQRALDANRTILHAWEALTPGKRRGLAYRVTSAKSLATREKRIDEVLEFLLDQA